MGWDRGSGGDGVGLGAANKAAATAFAPKKVFTLARKTDRKPRNTARDRQKQRP